MSIPCVRTRMELESPLNAQEDILYPNLVLKGSAPAAVILPLMHNQSEDTAPFDQLNAKQGICAT